jgi:hypothetical protein
VTSRFCDAAIGYSPAEATSAMGHLHALPRRSISVRFTSMSRNPPRSIVGLVRANLSFDHLVSAAEQRNREVRPSAFAVLRLMISSIFVTCCTGRSAGLSPLRMRPV